MGVDLESFSTSMINSTSPNDFPFNFCYQSGFGRPLQKKTLNRVVVC